MRPAENTECARWAENARTIIVCDPLPPHELQFQTEHASTCPRCGAQAHSTALLAALPDRLPVRPQDTDRIIEGVLRQWQGEKAALAAPARPFAWWRPAAVLGMGAALAAAAAALWFRPQPHAPVAEITGPATPAPEAVVTVLAAAAGSSANDSPVSAGARLETGAELVTRTGPLCLDLSTGVVACLEPNSHATLVDRTHASRRLHLHAGRVFARLAPQAKGQGFAVVTAHGSFRAVGTRFTVTAEPQAAHLHVEEGTVEASAAAASHRVHPVRAGHGVSVAGRRIAARSEAPAVSAVGPLAGLLAEAGATTHLVVRAAHGEALVRLGAVTLGPTPVSALVPAGRHELRAEAAGRTLIETVNFPGGGEVVRDLDLARETAPPAADEAPSPTPAAPRASRATSATAADLLARARTLRTQMRFGEAAKLYRELQRRYPNSAEANASWVLLADLQLTHLDQPRAALRSFERYLATGDTRFAREAAYGRVKALRAMGDAAGEQSAIDQLLARDPDGMHSESLRARRKALSPASNR